MPPHSRTFIAFVCTIALALPCIAQSPTSFSIVTTTADLSSTSGWTPNNIYSVDVNNDGIPDLIQDSASAGVTGALGEFGVSMGKGDGTFGTPTAYALPPGVLESPMAFGDFNGDGEVDIALSAGGRTVAIYLGKGDGTFQNPWYSVVPLSAGQSIAASPFVAADFNHDGKLDLAIVGADSTNTTVYILPGEGNGLFAQAMPIFTAPTGINASGSAVQSLLLGDFDSDDNADLAIATTTGNSDGGIASTAVHVLYGNGDFTFDDTTEVNFAGPLQINAGDLNGDGSTDLFAIDPNGYRLDTYYAQPGRTFATYTTAIPQAPYGGSNYMGTPAMADFNDDGHMDLVVTVASGDAAKVYMMFFLAGANPGEFTTQTWNVLSYTTVSYQTAPVVADFNGDSKPDFAIVQYFGPGSTTIYTGLNATSHGLWSNCAYPTEGRGISVCAPAGSSTAPTNFNATARSYGQLRKMELWVDGTKLAEQHNVWEGNAFFNFSSAMANGSHLGTIYAADVDNTLDRTDFRFTVGPSSCSAPAEEGVHICSPASGNTTSATPVLVEASAKITGPLARMEVWVDGMKKYTETNATSLSASIPLSAGVHQFTVYAVNTDGVAWNDTVSATVP